MFAVLGGFSRVYVPFSTNIPRILISHGNFSGLFLFKRLVSYCLLGVDGGGMRTPLLFSF